MSGTTRLHLALDDLIDFLETVPGRGTDYWLARLRDIRSALLVPSRQSAARTELRGSFGGMDSLNDFVVDPRNDNVPAGADPAALNAELDRLLDVTFRELTLHGAGPLARLSWWWRERRHSDRPPTGGGMWQRATERPYLKNVLIHFASGVMMASVFAVVMAAGHVIFSSLGMLDRDPPLGAVIQGLFLAVPTASALAALLRPVVRAGRWGRVCVGVFVGTIAGTLFYLPFAGVDVLATVIGAGLGGAVGWSHADDADVREWLRKRGLREH